jgi:adenylate kinase family enzyme
VTRIAIIGNAAGGKSMLASQLADRLGLPLIEVDKLLWQQKGVNLIPSPTYFGEHAKIIAQDKWVFRGLGHQNSIAERLARSTEIVLIDLPLWMHFSLAAERQIEEQFGASPDGFVEIPGPPRDAELCGKSTKLGYQPASYVPNAELEGKIIRRLTSLTEIEAFAENL